MTRVDKVIDKDLGKYPYYVEIKGTDGKWRSQVRYYFTKQNEADYPDNNIRRNFKYLGDG